MPTKRRLSRRAGGIVTPAAVEAYRSGDERALCFAIGQAPWEFTPLEVEGPTPPAWLDDRPDRHQYWAKAWALRCELDAALQGGN